MRMAETTFGITYDGPALRDGVMPVRELAPSLLSLAEAFTAASLVKYPTREPVALHIKATEEGSFLVDLIAASTKVFDDAVDIFGSNPMQALEGLVFSIVGAHKSLFWLIKLAHGQNVEKEEATPAEPGHVTLTFPDGTEIKGVPTDVAALYKNIPIRRHARQVVAPLREEGVDEIRFNIDGTQQASIEKADLPAYEIPPEAENVELDVIQPMVLDIVSPVFEEGKWGFFDGDRRFSAVIEDEAFIARVDAGEPFAKGDTLHCDVRVIQSRRDKRLVIERRIVRVREHHKAADGSLSLLDEDVE